MEKHLDLLFGIHALRLGFIDMSLLLDCLAVCLASRPAQHMADVLLSRKLVTPRQVDAVDALVRAQLGRHGNNPARAFRATELEDDLRQQLLRQLEQAGGSSQTPTALAQLKRSVSKARAVEISTTTVYVTRAPAGKYSLAEKLGEGGLGTVMMAVDNDIGRPIAIKFVRQDVPDQFLDRFRRESIVTGRLEHPNIVPVHDIGMMDMAAGKDDRADARAGRGRKKKAASKRQLYMAMKLIKGRDLGEVLRSILEGDKQAADKWSLRRLVEAFHNVCNAIAYAHSQGIIHRDLKPSNIMIGEFGEVLVVDWGLAKVAGEQDLHEQVASRKESAAGREDRSRSRVSDLLGSSVHTIEGAVMGTPQYMPPEQAAGRVSQIDERSDIYSLGAILYEILTFCPPFEGATSREVLMKVLTEDLARPSERLQSERDWFRNVGRPVAGRGTAAPTGGLTIEPVTSCPAAFEKQAIPPELEEICMKCLAKRKKERYQSALELGEEIRLYLEGAKERERRHELAEAAVAEGRKLVKTYFLLKETAAAEKKNAREAEARVSGYLPLEQKQELWAVQDRAKAAERSVVMNLGDAIAKLMEAIGHEHGNENARRAICELYWDRFIAAEQRDDEMDMAYYRSLLLTYGREWYTSRLKGNGTLVVRTRRFECKCLRPVGSIERGQGEVIAVDAGAGSGGLDIVLHDDEMVETPWDGSVSDESDRNLIPRVELRGAARHGHDSSCRAADLAGADVRIFEFAEFKRRLAPTYPEGLARVLGIPEDEIAARKREGAARAEANPPCLSPQDGLYLGPTPTLPIPIPPGSYLLLIEKAGLARLRCPLLIHREEKTQRTITVYDPEDCPAGLVAVPADEFIFGETEAGHELEVRRLDDFFIGVNPVTCAEYLEFLNDVAATDPAQAKSRAPRAAEQVGHYWEPDENGVFRLPSPGERQLAAGGRQQDWRPDQPVTCVSWHDALAYCRWKSNKDGRVYMLPTEEQREKAARGVDGRSFPFGRYCDPTFCNVRDSFPDGIRLTGVEEFPLDESPYGAMGMAGNAREWCLNDGGRRWRNWRALRGGSCDQSTWHSHAGRRFGSQPNGVNWIHGFRLMSPCRLDAGGGLKQQGAKGQM